jgi:hypothetical protein
MTATSTCLVVMVLIENSYLLPDVIFVINKFTGAVL